MFDDKQKNPYSYNGNQWIGYDNMQSVQIKAEYAVARNLGGIMVWSIDYADAKNVCGGGAFPLLQTINRVFSGVSVSQFHKQLSMQFSDDVCH